MRKELIILSGFLGSGKTTLLRSLLLRHSDRKIAVLLNDFGDIPVDGETLRRSGVEGGVVVEIGGGSVFCSCLREPFIKALANLAARDEDLIIVEASGMSDPSAVDKMLRLSGLDGLFEHTSTICLFDPVKSLKLARVLEVIRGFLSHNIEGLHLLEEGSWKAPNTDVWGLSDLDLFREAAAALTKSPKPFVAVIQTAGFHRPYTIPEDNAGFQIKQPSEAILKNYGFTGADEYNSLRFSDHSLGEFFKIARQQPWFDNTVFAIFGDHGLNDTSLNMSPGYLACRLQSNHTPMLIYAPGLVAAGKLQPGVDGRPCGQPDIFPTLASLAGIPYRYNAMGRNLLDPDTKRDEMQFLGGETESTVRLVENGYCYIRETDEHTY